MTWSGFRRASDVLRLAVWVSVVTLALALNAFCYVRCANATLTNGENAIDELGQYNSSTMADNPAIYTKGCINDGASPFGFNEGTSSQNPGGTIDAVNHRLFVADSVNNRVLVFTLNSSNQISSKTPTNVIGQPDFVTCALATTSASSLNTPDGMDFDAINNRLFVADTFNDRVLVFNTSSITNGMSASFELGQPSGTAFTSNTQLVSQSGLNRPSDVKYDSVNNRVLVADTANNRIMIYNNGSPGSISNGENASFELGHASGGTAFTATASGHTAATFNSPSAITYDSADTLLYVVDSANNRVLAFNVATGTIANGASASFVLGQANFTANGNSTTQASFSAPFGVAYDSTNNRLFVADGSGNRVLVFPTSNIISGENATDELGQYNSSSMADNPPIYTKGCINDGASPFGFNTLNSSAIDPVNHWLFVADYQNNRVLVFPLTSGNVLSSKTPSYVLGEPDFVTCAPGAISAATMAGPGYVAVDSANQRVFVGDVGNSRVLVFNTASMSNGMSASFELGQPSGGTAFTTGGHATTQSGLYAPQGLAYDATDGWLFVADGSNNRVMVFNVAPGTIANGENASFELGQPSGGTAFTTATVATSQSGMQGPTALAYDSANTRLFVAEYGNSRVTVFNVASGTIANGENASFELGQAAGGTAFTTGLSATTQSGMSNPNDLAYDSANTRLFVDDLTNSRVLVFNVAPGTIANGENASFELGQASGGTAFTTAATATTQSGMNKPAGLTFDGTNNLLYVDDQNNHRLMLFNVATGSIANGENASDLLGQYNSATSASTVVYTQNGANNGPNNLGFNDPEGIAMDTVHHYLFVADYANSRVLVYGLNSDNTLSDHTADYVLGQAGLQGAHTVATTQSGMNGPAGLVVDNTNSRLFVADAGNHRVLIFDTSAISTGMNASHVLGQADFTHGSSNRGGAPAQNSMSTPIDVAYDAANNRLFVADAGNNRVLIYTTLTTDGTNAANQLGQANFTTGTANRGSTVARNSLSDPDGLVWDSVNSRLFVGDQGNNRVLMWSTFTNGVNAANVLGQANFTSGGVGATASTMNAPQGVAYDAINSRLYVADQSNSRVMEFNVAPTVIANGMSDSSSVGGFNTTQSSLGGAVDHVYYDSTQNRLFANDIGNNRIMIFNTNNAGQLVNQEAAQYVLGQTLFTANNLNAGGTTAGQVGFAAPAGLIYDNTNSLLYVADQDNNRFMQFNVAPATIANGENASDELGEYTSATSTASVLWTANSPNNGPNNLGFNGAGAVAIDTVHHYLFVADSGNHRVLVYALNTDNSFNGHTATYVLGQPNLQGSCSPATSQSGMNQPDGLAVDMVNQRLFVAEKGNNRVTVFNTSSMSNGMNAAHVLGQSTFTTPGGTTTQSGLKLNFGLIALDSVNNLLYVADASNNRVMVFNVATGSIADGENASFELGQPSGGTAFTTATAATTQSGMNEPLAVAIDTRNSNLYVGDYLNNRVLVFSTASLANGENASLELGQPSGGTAFTTGTATTSQSGMSGPVHLSVDMNNNRLFMADQNNSRVLVYNTSNLSNGMNAAYELGQTTFSGGSTNGGGTGPSQSGVSQAGSALYDPATNHVFVIDEANNRILIFDGSFMGNWPPGYE